VPGDRGDLREPGHPSNSCFEAIVDATADCGTDLIFMGSHGRKGIRARILGSETLRSLTHSPIPVPGYPCWSIAPASAPLRPEAGAAAAGPSASCSNPSQPSPHA